MSTPDGFTWETRDVGEHDWRYTDGLCDCALCGARAWEAGDDPCPSVQERRLVGPWEPVEEPS